MTNASFIRSEAAAGVRACLQQEFTDVWVFDLRGDGRRTGDGRNIFEYPGQGSGGTRTPVAIFILVKNPNKKKRVIHYSVLEDEYYSGQGKRDRVKQLTSIKGIAKWQAIKPDKHHDWLDQRTSEFSTYLPMGGKNAKAGKGNTLFRQYSNGVKTHRDPWAYHSSKKELTKNMKIHIDYCNNYVDKKPIHIDYTQAKWDPELTRKLKISGIQEFDENKIRFALYRPFFKQWLYFDRVFNPRQGIVPKTFPQNNSKNLIICVSTKSITFSAFVLNITPDVGIESAAQCFPLYTYENGVKQENITNCILKEYQEHYADKKITKSNIFYYAYGLLHHPKYRKKYANNLTRELPHIPMAPDFWSFCTTGKKLADLHLSWEACQRYELGKPKAEFGKYEKMAFARIKRDGKLIQDKTTLKINGIEVFDNIPETNYKVNGRTPLEWAIDRYKKTTDRESGIVNDATNVDIIPLIERLVYVGVESDRLVRELPVEFEPKDWEPKKTGMDAFTDSGKV